MDTRYDVVIVGGGVTGCSTALFLAREPGFDGTILVVERDPTYEHAPSAKATGGFRQQFSTPRTSASACSGCTFSSTSTSTCRSTVKRPTWAFARTATCCSPPARCCRRCSRTTRCNASLGPTSTSGIRPSCNRASRGSGTDGVAGGFLSDSNEGYIDPYSLVQAYRRKARSLGVEFVRDEAVSVQSDGARVTGVTLAGAGHVACGVVVNAAGAYGAPEICASLDVELPIESRKRFTFVFECRQPIGPDAAHHHRGRGRVPLRGQADSSPTSPRRPSVIR